MQNCYVIVLGIVKQTIIIVIFGYLFCFKTIIQCITSLLHAIYLLGIDKKFSYNDYEN